MVRNIESIKSSAVQLRWPVVMGGGDPTGAHLRYSATTVGGEMSVEWTGFSFSEESVGLGGGGGGVTGLEWGILGVPGGIECIETMQDQHYFIKRSDYNALRRIRLESSRIRRDFGK